MKSIMKRIFALVLAIVSIGSVFTVCASAASMPSIKYKTHVECLGWLPNSYDGAISGTVGKSLRLEALQVRISGMSGGVSYRVHSECLGWGSWRSNGSSAGTTGRSLRAEAVQIKLTGTISKYYDVVYRSHVQGLGWLNWVKNGDVSGTTGRSLRMESIQIKLVAKSGGSSGSSSTTTNSSAEATIMTRLQSMMNGSYAENTYKVNTRYTGLYANEECKGFAKRVHQILFGYNIGSTKSNKYEISYSSKNSVRIGRLTSLSTSSLKNLFDNARAGDFIQVKRKSGTPHSMIYLSSDSNGVTVYECNVDGANGIIKATYNWQQFKSANSAVSVYTAKNYKLH